VDATFVPWLWASVYTGEERQLFPLFGAPTRTFGALCSTSHLRSQNWHRLGTGGTTQKDAGLPKHQRHGEFAVYRDHLSAQRRPSFGSRRIRWTTLNANCPWVRLAGESPDDDGVARDAGSGAPPEVRTSRQCQAL